MKTADLAHDLLDYWIGKAEGLPVGIHRHGACQIKEDPPGAWGAWAPYHPSFMWSQGGPLIDKHRISLDGNPDSSRDGQWTAHGMWGDSALVAAMRHLVFEKFGAEVGDEPPEVAG